jgi:hypothetical protein
MKAKNFINAVKFNNLSEVELLLKNKSLDDYKKRSKALQHSSFMGLIEMTELLLSDELINPALNKNYAINVSYIKGYKHIIALLWNDQRVKNTLKNDNLELYNLLIQKEVHSKLKKF